MLRNDLINELIEIEMRMGEVRDLFSSISGSIPTSRIPSQHRELTFPLPCSSSEVFLLGTRRVSLSPQHGHPGARFCNEIVRPVAGE